MKYGCSSWKTKNYYIDFSLPETSLNFLYTRVTVSGRYQVILLKNQSIPISLKVSLSIGLLRILKTDLQIKPKILPHVSETYPDTHLEVKALILKSNYFKLLIN